MVKSFWTGANIYFPKNTLEWTSILADVHCRPHARIHEHFPHCVIDWELTGTKTVVQHDKFLTYTRKSLDFQPSICFAARIVVRRQNFPIFAGHRVELPQTELFCPITLCFWGSTRCCVIAHKCNELPCAQCNRTRNYALLRQPRSLSQSAGLRTNGAAIEGFSCGSLGALT